jgi:hypothetical protein
VTSFEQLLDNAVDRYRERLVAALGRMREAREPVSFCDAEREVDGLAHDLVADLVGGVVQDISDDRERQRAALARVRERATREGIQLRVERKRRTPFRTLGGRQVYVTTPYATARPRGRGCTGSERVRGAKGTGVYPVLDELGIAERATPALRLLVSRAVCEANSVSSARELLAGGGVDIDHKAALRLTYRVARVALRARKKAIAGTTEGNDGGAFVGRRVVATIDGGRVQIRRRVPGRPKKGGRKRFVTEWREPKIITIYVVGEDGKRDRSVPPIIDGTLGDADQAFALLRYHLLHVGAHKAEKLALIGDAAEWIWNRADGVREALGLPPERFHEIIDYFHVVERLGELAKAQGWEEDVRLTWLRVQKQRLKAGDIEAIEHVIRSLEKRYPDPERWSTERAYWDRNRERLRYASFRAFLLPIGSGAVESSVRRVINLRLKGASIAWTEKHAEGVLHLRANAKSGRWRDLELIVLHNSGWRPTSRLRRSAAAA